MTLLEIMGRVARARDRASMGQKHAAEFWQWIVGRKQWDNGFPRNSIDDAIEKLEEALHDLQTVKDEIDRRYRA